MDDEFPQSKFIAVDSTMNSSQEEFLVGVSSS